MDWREGDFRGLIGWSVGRVGGEQGRVVARRGRGYGAVR